ncbi:phosphatase PAP2 family protein [Ruicaihuangia caeni]|uniref:phosphatase PAP2 family protein n=1 Tax=Ruicaihuangia caeni TaxID=3042517 RepID=UPI00338EB3B2
MSDAQRRTVPARPDPLRPLRRLSGGAGMPLVVALIAGIAVVVWFGIAVATSSEWSRAESRVLGALIPQHRPVPDAVALAIDAVFDPAPALAITIAVATAVAAATRDIARAATFALTVLVSWRTGELVKLLVQRARPDVLDNGHSHADLVSSTAYPSGHVGFATALSIGILVLARDHRRRSTIVSPACVLFVAVVAYSRMYLGLHYPTDVLAGAVLAMCVAGVFLAWWLNRALPVLTMAAGWLRPPSWRP